MGRRRGLGRYPIAPNTHKGAGQDWSPDTSHSRVLSSNKVGRRLQRPQDWRQVWLPCHSVAKSCLTLCNPMNCSMPCFPVLHYLPEFAQLMSIESVMPSNHLILCHPLLPSIFPSVSIFSNGSVLRIRWPEYWSFSFSINPYDEYSGLISFKIDWSDLLVVQGTLKSLLQHHSSKA